MRDLGVAREPPPCHERRGDLILDGLQLGTHLGGTSGLVCVRCVYVGKYVRQCALVCQYVSKVGALQMLERGVWYVVNGIRFRAAARGRGRGGGRGRGARLRRQRRTRCPEAQGLER